jgi:hypothetical protein
VIPPICNNCSCEQLVFANPQALEAFDASGVPTFGVAQVGVVNDSYRLFTAPSAALLAAVDGVNVIAATAPVGAVWTRLYEQNLPAQYETDWFLDAAAGDDRNDGLTALTAIRTMHELSVRLKGAKLTANATVTVAAGDYSADPVLFDLEIPSGVSILFQGAVTSVADTVAAILPTVQGTAATNAGAQRGTLTATTFDFQAANDRQRLRITAGTAANVGGIAWITRVVTPGVGGVVNVTRWGKLTNVRTSTALTQLTIALGDTYAVDTLTSQLGQIDCRVRGPGRLILQDFLVRTSSTIAHRGVNDGGSFNGVQAYGCKFESAGATVFYGGEWTTTLCSFSSDVNAVGFVNGLNLYARGCVWGGAVATQLTVNSGAKVQQDYACMDNTQLIISTGGIWDQIGGNNFDIQFCDCTGTHAVDVAEDGTYWAHSGNNRQWGLNNAFTQVPFLIEQGGNYRYNAAPSVPGRPAASDVTVGTVSDVYANLPIVITTAAAGTAASTGAGCLMAV